MKKIVFTVLFFASMLCSGQKGGTGLLLDSLFQNYLAIESSNIQEDIFANHWVNSSRDPYALQSLTSESNNQKGLQFNFKVSSIKVDDNFITSKLASQLQTGKVYRISIDVAKDKFSGFGLRELTANFSTTYISNRGLRYYDNQHNSVTFSLDSIHAGSSFVTLTADYISQGGEQYIHFGSINQEFKFLETTKYNLMLADASYKQGVYNSVYYVSKMTIKEVEKNEYSKNAMNGNNFHDLSNSKENLIVNGGFENDLPDHMQSTYSGNCGNLIAPFIHSVNGISPWIIQSDSNDYRSVYQRESLPYMGNSLASFKTIATNENHQYQKQTFLQKGQEYNTLHVYENSPVSESIPIYKKGAVIVFSLCQELIKDSIYSLSLMVKMDEGASFGLDYLGVHLLGEFPSNVTEDYWSKVPDEVIPIEDLCVKDYWVEKQILVLAKGGERFIALGAVYPKYQLIQNKNFRPIVLSECGPNSSYCYDRRVVYRDSLFANYYLDNLVCLPIGKYQDNPSAIFSNSPNQVQVIFTPLLRQEDLLDTSLLKVQDALVTSLNVLRINDAICIADISKKDPITLEPYEIINKRKIIRKIYKPKLHKRQKEYLMDDAAILFTGEAIKGFENHVVIIADGHFDMAVWEYKLTKFDRNGGHLTFVYVGNPEQKESFKSQVTFYPNSLLLDASEGDLTDAIIKRILLKM